MNARFKSQSYVIVRFDSDKLFESRTDIVFIFCEKLIEPQCWVGLTQAPGHTISLHHMVTSHCLDSFHLLLFKLRRDCQEELSNLEEEIDSQWRGWSQGGVSNNKYWCSPHKHGSQWSSPIAKVH